MKKYLFLLLSAFLLTACGNSNSSTVEYSEPAVEVEESTTYEEAEESSSAETEESSGPHYVIKKRPTHPNWISTYRTSGVDERGRRYPLDLPDMEYIRDEGKLNWELWVVWDSKSTGNHRVIVGTINGKPHMIYDNHMGIDDSQIPAFLNSDEGDWDLYEVKEISEDFIQGELDRASYEHKTAVDENWNSIE